jgi:hypothetical protein
MAGFDATPATLAAQNYMKYAQDYWLRQSKPQSIRGEGGAIVTPGGAYQSTVVRKILGPDNREWQVTQNTIESGRPYGGVGHLACPLAAASGAIVYGHVRNAAHQEPIASAVS